ncbi:MAG: hypothetical protein J0H98_03150 [Solirubrobacterales bacterium]|nr:hypothetical protein [Solirubrobacterales bacterium]
MKTARNLCLLVLAIFALGAASAANASADTGSGAAMFTLSGGTPCPTDFRWDTGSSGGVPPSSGQSIDVGDFNPTGACAIDVIDSGGEVDLNPGGTVSSVGGIDFDIDAGLFGSCEYAGSVSGTWTSTPDANGNLIDMSGTATRIAGSPFCPSPVSFTITAQSFTPDP